MSVAGRGHIKFIFIEASSLCSVGDGECSDADADADSTGAHSIVVVSLSLSSNDKQAEGDEAGLSTLLMRGE